MFLGVVFVFSFVEERAVEIYTFCFEASDLFSCLIEVS
jgi:hypothetical protein